MQLQIKPATIEDIPLLWPYVKAYHQFEGINISDQERETALRQLLSDKQLGSVWLIFADSLLIGYIVLCYGFSIEFRGRDAFIDEFYIDAEHRGLGHGRQVLSQLKILAQQLRVKAIHLEVGENNEPARRLYETMGFRSRHYSLMSCRLSSEEV